MARSSPPPARRSPATAALSPQTGRGAQHADGRFANINMPAAVTGERIGRSLLGRRRQQKALFCATFMIMLHKPQPAPTAGLRARPRIRADCLP
jgi:hypothetical protein